MQVVEDGGAGEGDARRGDARRVGKSGGVWQQYFSNLRCDGVERGGSLQVAQQAAGIPGGGRIPDVPVGSDQQEMPPGGPPVACAPSPRDQSASAAGYEEDGDETNSVCTTTTTTTTATNTPRLEIPTASQTATAAGKLKAAPPHRRARRAGKWTTALLQAMDEFVSRMDVSEEAGETCQVGGGGGKADEKGSLPSTMATTRTAMMAVTGGETGATQDVCNSDASSASRLSSWSVHFDADRSPQGSSQREVTPQPGGVEDDAISPRRGEGGGWTIVHDGSQQQQQQQQQQRRAAVVNRPVTMPMQHDDVDGLFAGAGGGAVASRRREPSTPPSREVVETVSPRTPPRALREGKGGRGGGRGSRPIPKSLLLG
jgi:hypothetical protein